MINYKNLKLETYLHKLSVFFSFAILLAAHMASAQNLPVGIILPLTGPGASMGESFQGLVRLTALQAITPHFEDDMCDSKKALTAYFKLRNEDIHVFYVGCSGSILAIAPHALRNGDLLVTASAGSSRIRDTGTEVIRINPDAISIASAALRLITPDRQPTALLYEEQDYASSLADSLTQSLGTNIVKSVSYRADGGSFTTEILSIKKENPKSLFLIPVADGTARIILKQLGQQHFAAPVLGEANLCDYPFKPAEFGLHGQCVAARFKGEAFAKFMADFAALNGFPSKFPFNDALSLDLLHHIDLIATAEKNLAIPMVKEKILAGFTGTFAQYRFTPKGEIDNIQDYLEPVTY